MEHLLREAGPALHEKDRVLDALAHAYNVAQFASFAPDLSSRFSRVQGLPPNHSFQGVREAAGVLLRESSEGSVNVRSFVPWDPKSREFIYGLKELDRVVASVERLAGSGLHTIVNETVDIHDAGVSGVILDGVIEFSPDATPRCVEEAGVAALPREMGLQMLEIVYGFRPQFNIDPTKRIEFSIHPRRRGWKHDHTIVWEVETVRAYAVAVRPSWPNNFSRLLGDKVFGLLVAHLCGLNVPRSTVINRRLAPFSFGLPTGTSETWTRTSPSEAEPGLFTTCKGWLDPFGLVTQEDPAGMRLASVISQEGVEAEYSGALVGGSDDRVVIEGVRGQGDAFMLGERGPENLPTLVVDAIRDAYHHATASIGPVKAEWAYDGERAWILQLHAGATQSAGRVIVPGQPSRYRPFEVSRGLQEFRTFVESAKRDAYGVALRGQVGITSHFGDILRRAGVPSILEP